MRPSMALPFLACILVVASSCCSNSALDSAGTLVLPFWTLQPLWLGMGSRACAPAEWRM
ncbi:uncharacterized protein BP01DRAFT_174117 [Aspergillus saccharolyticus JOP 1030-1]|uniref:Uncharacterized protein n=1 Tax=Aspergillus saccharolyticus JOP 1030-1 TaxID=1450539 RepID=A0A318ZNA7_9EURO|nr:hypothetical protein BP01DRAFT_174117 [Aspergillus saccharolyticus JOP 1030-1]PYH47984.1 hypothetical protein BP01DRAFT_174117 [Aspergillus saccharolyticus JOP 1030-1]